MSLFHELQRRRARALFVSLDNSDVSQMAEAVARDQAADVMVATSAGAALLPSLDLESFDVIVNLGDQPIPKLDGVYMLDLPVPDFYAEERVEQIVEFLGGHFRWAREWKFTEPAESRTKAAPRLAIVPRPAAARAALA